MAISCAMLWGLAIAYFKKSEEIMSPMVLTLYKSLISSLLFLPIMMLIDPVPGGSSLLTTDVFILCLSGILGISLADSLIFKCLHSLGAGLFGVVDCLYSPILILFSCVLLSTPLTTPEIIGSCLVISAVLMATLKTGNSSEDHPHLWSGIMYGAMGMCLMAVSIILMKPVLDDVSVWWVTGIRLISSTLVLFVMVYYAGKWKQFRGVLWNKKVLKHALPGTLLGNFLAMTLWIAAFKYTDVHSAAILNQTSTIFIVLFASLILKEPFTKRRLGATLLAFSGAMIVIL